MAASHLELLVEEPSMEAFLQSWFPKYLPDNITYRFIVFNGKTDLLSKLRDRLKGYSKWIPVDWRIIVVVDRDEDDCVELTNQINSACALEGFPTYHENVEWKAASSIAIEELEAWYFGEWRSVVEAYPRVSMGIVKQARYRDSDAILGGTWEAFERILQKSGYFAGGLRKVEAARTIGKYVDVNKNSSGSFQIFLSIINAAISNR